MLIELTDLAKSDIESILEYTEGKWGRRQKDKYNDLLYDAIQDIANNPLSAYTKKVKKGKAPTRYYRVGKHHIYYVIENNKISVTRILHGQMDADLHL